MPINAGTGILNVAVSRDGKWIVSGTDKGVVMAWNAESHEKVTEFKGHRTPVRAVDVSPDGTKIATGSADYTACIWSLSTGQRLCGPLKHDYEVLAAKISPDGCLLATATLGCVRVYHCLEGRVLVDVPIRVSSLSLFNNFLAWANDSKRLFALSFDGNIHCLDVSTGTTLSKWSSHSSKDVRCIALAGNGTFIAASAGRSASFWNTGTHEQIGSVIEFAHDIWCMAISPSDDLAVGGDKKITLRGLCDILPSSYFDDVSSLTSVA